MDFFRSRRQPHLAVCSAACLGFGLALSACSGQPEREAGAPPGAAAETGTQADGSAADAPAPAAATDEPETNPAEPATPTPPNPPGGLDPALRHKAEQRPVLVLVETAGGPPAVTALVAAAREAGVEFVQTIDEERLVRMQADAGQLDRVMATGLVTTVHEDTLHR
jgi:hypothetical protein